MRPPLVAGYLTAGAGAAMPRRRDDRRRRQRSSAARRPTIDSVHGAARPCTCRCSSLRASAPAVATRRHRDRGGGRCRAPTRRARCARTSAGPRRAARAGGARRRAWRSPAMAARRRRGAARAPARADRPASTAAPRATSWCCSCPTRRSTSTSARGGPLLAVAGGARVTMVRGDGTVLLDDDVGPTATVTGRRRRHGARRRPGRRQLDVVGRAGRLARADPRGARSASQLRSAPAASLAVDGRAPAQRVGCSGTAAGAVARGAREVTTRFSRAGAHASSSPLSRHDHRLEPDPSALRLRRRPSGHRRRRCRAARRDRGRSSAYDQRARVCRACPDEGAGVGRRVGHGAAAELGCVSGVVGIREPVGGDVAAA